MTTPIVCDQIFFVPASLKGIVLPNLPDQNTFDGTHILINNQYTLFGQNSSLKWIEENYDQYQGTNEPFTL